MQTCKKESYNELLTNIGKSGDKEVPPTGRRFHNERLS